MYWKSGFFLKYEKGDLVNSPLIKCIICHVNVEPNKLKGHLETKHDSKEESWLEFVSNKVMEGTYMLMKLTANQKIH